MSPEPTLQRVFLQYIFAAAEKPIPNDVASATLAPGTPLVTFGKKGHCIVFSDMYVQLVSNDGNPITYTWEMLDFIFPVDLALGGDKLFTYCDLGPVLN